MKKIMAGLSDSRGFTLLELAIVLAGMAIVTTAAVPYFIRQAEVTAAHRTSKEVASIQEAAKWYYISNKAWPASVATLQTAGYLNPSWSATNPWGNTYSISSNSTSLTVTTTLPDAIGGALSRALPGVSYTTVGSDRTTNSVIPVPGQEASLANKAEVPSFAFWGGDTVYSVDTTGAPQTNPIAVTVPERTRMGIIRNGTTYAEWVWKCPTGYVMIGYIAGNEVSEGVVCSKVQP